MTGPTTTSPVADAVEARPIPHLPVFERELTVADVLDGAFQVIKARPRVILGIAAMVVLPIGLLVALIDFGALGGDVIASLTDPETYEQTTDSGDTDLGFTAVSTLVSSAMVTVMAAAIGRVVEAWYLGTELSAWRAVRSVGPIWFSVVIAFVLSRVIVAGATLLLILPGIAAMAFLMPLAPVVSLERAANPFAAIRRSFSLVSNRFWYVLWIAVLTGVVASTLSLMLPLLPIGIVALIDEGGQEYVAGASTIAASLLVLPFVAAGAVLTYFDLRVRTEGLDIRHQMAAAFGGRQ